MEPEIIVNPYYQNSKSQQKGIKKTFSKRVFMISFVILIFGGFLIWIFNPVTFFLPKKQNKTWIISQSLASTLGRQQVLGKYSYAGELELDSLVKAVTASVLPNEEAVRIGDKTIMSTSSLGQVTANFPSGRYKVAVMPIPGVDLTGIPNKIDLLTPAQEIPIGIKKGSGKVIGVTKKFNLSFSQAKKDQSEETTKLIISLFHDLNGDGKKQKEEQGLKWAGVTVELAKE